MATDLRVGGRMETVAPKPVTDPGDRWRLVVLALVSVAVHVWLIANATVTARDGPGYATLAYRYENPDSARPFGRDATTGELQTEGVPWSQLNVMKDSHHPPGYPVATLLVSYVVRPLASASDPEEFLLSAQVASAVAAFLLVFPSYWLGKLMFGQFVGFVAALLIQILPQFAEATSDSLTEGLFLLFVGTALMFGVRAVKTPRVSGFLLSGLATGLAFLVRPEGAIVGGAVGVVGLGMIAARRWPFGRGVAWLTALTTGALLAALPYMVLIGGLTNKPTGQNLIPTIHSIREKLTGAGGPSTPAIFADRYHADQDGPLAPWVVKAIAKETSKSFHYAPLGLAVIGLLVSARRFRAEPWLWVPVALVGFQFATLAALGYHGSELNQQVGRQHYIAERHTLPIVFVGCFFAAAGLSALPGLFSRTAAGSPAPGRSWVVPVVLAAVVVSCVPKLVRPLHGQRVAHQQAGRWLAEEANLQPDETLIDPYQWANFFAGRTLRNPRPDVQHPKVSYAVIRPRDMEDDPDSLFTSLSDARKIVRDGRSKVVFQWPPDAPPEKVELRIYKLQQ